MKALDCTCCFQRVTGPRNNTCTWLRGQEPTSPNYIHIIFPGPLVCSYEPGKEMGIRIAGEYSEKSASGSSTRKARQLFAPVNRASVSGVSPPPTKDGQKTRRKERSLASRLLCTHASVKEVQVISYKEVHPVGKAIFLCNLPNQKLVLNRMQVCIKAKVKVVSRLLFPAHEKVATK